MDGEGRDDARAARICATVNTTAMNVARRSGVAIPDDLYLAETDYLPIYSRPKRKRQTWAEMSAGLRSQMRINR